MQGYLRTATQWTLRNFQEMVAERRQRIYGPPWLVRPPSPLARKLRAKLRMMRTLIMYKMIFCLEIFRFGASLLIVYAPDGRFGLGRATSLLLRAGL